MKPKTPLTEEEVRALGKKYAITEPLPDDLFKRAGEDQIRRMVKEAGSVRNYLRKSQPGISPRWRLLVHR